MRSRSTWTRPRCQVHARPVPRLRQKHGLMPPRRLGPQQEHRCKGGAGRRRHQRHAARLRQRQQGGLGQSSHARRICHQQYRLDARRRPDAFLHRPRRTPPSPTLAASPRPRRRRVAGGLRAADAARLTTRAQTPRWSGPTASSATYCPPTTTAARTTATVASR